MNLLRRYIRNLLYEDAMGFVHDLAAASDEFGKEGEDFYGGDPGKGGGRAIKRAFNAHADHKWLATLDTVHWSTIYGLEDLKGQNRDELSATMSLPEESIRPAPDHEVGLWIKGRITLAANDMDSLYTGFWSDYGAGKGMSGLSRKQAAHRDKSSGRNKRPMVSKDYSRYGNLERGNEYAEMQAKKIPYILDKSMWDPKGWNKTNEALVDNWKAVGIVVSDMSTKEILKSLKYSTEEEINEALAGSLKKLLLTALSFGISVYDEDRNVIWSPE